VDDRPATKLGLATSLKANVAQTFAVTGRVPTDPSRNIPTGAVAVTGTLTVVGQTALGWLGLTKTPQNAPGTSTLNFPMGDIRATGVTVPLGSGGKLSVTYVAKAGNATYVVFDVTGYFLN
jgi:hypothetical protein